MKQSSEEPRQTKRGQRSPSRRMRCDFDSAGSALAVALTSGMFAGSAQAAPLAQATAALQLLRLWKTPASIDPTALPRSHRANREFRTRNFTRRGRQLLL